MSADMESELRSLVRELISQVLPDLQPREEVREVTIDSDQDLARFVDQVRGLCEDQHTAERIRTGRIRFSLARADGQVERPSSSEQDRNAEDTETRGGPSLRIDKGAVTERVLAQAPTGTRILLGRAAVLTPLAREFARKNGINLERVP